MTVVTIQVPRINDTLSDFHKLARIWAQVREVNDRSHFVFDFSHCDFLRPNAVVFLGGMVRLIEYWGGHAQLLVDTIQSAVQANLMQNGFAQAMGAEVSPWRGNSIPYREDRYQNKDTIIYHLKENWLGRGWVNVSPTLSNEIVGQMWEIFANAFEHSRTPTGVISCGQYLPNLRELLLVVADFGVGIPFNARSCANASFDGKAALCWAFSRGTSSAHSYFPGVDFSRGLGLDLLKEFVIKTKGTLEVFSNDGYARIDQSGENYQNLATSFEGTLVQVRLHCDDRYYLLRSETNPASYF